MLGPSALRWRLPGPSLDASKSVQFAGFYLQARGLGRQVQGCSCWEKKSREPRRQPFLPCKAEGLLAASKGPHLEA